MSEEIKPDGYCAWHPERGYFGEGLCLSRTPNESERRVIASLYTRQIETNLAACQREYDAAGWIVRPVNIIEHEKYKALMGWLTKLRASFVIGGHEGGLTEYGCTEYRKELDAIMGEK
ncbi:MAG TPA: hypothetical protein PLK06_01460 [bacterium]|nr:hypothetical protein [bacterium]